MLMVALEVFKGTLTIDHDQRLNGYFYFVSATAAVHEAVGKNSHFAILIPNLFRQHSKKEIADTFR